MLKVGELYKRAQIAEIFQCTYNKRQDTNGWKIYDDKIIAIYANVGKAGRNGKVKLDYPNRIISENSVLWNGPSGYRHKNEGSPLWKIFNRKLPVKIFLRTTKEQEDNGQYIYWGEVNAIKYVASTEEKKSGKTKVLEYFVLSKLDSPDVDILNAICSFNSPGNEEQRKVADLSKYDNKKKSGYKKHVDLGELGWSAEADFHDKCIDGHEIAKKLGIKDIEKLIWEYGEERMFSRYDFSYEDKYIEIKSTVGEDEKFFLSKNEYNFMEEKLDKYFIVLYTNSRSKNLKPRLYSGIEISKKFAIQKEETYQYRCLVKK